MAVLNYLDHTPALGSGVVVAESAVVVGNVSITGPCVIEDNAVLRGDQNRVQVGARCRFGRAATAHVELQTPTILGADVWVGDEAVVHACTLGDGVRVEDGGLVLSNSSVGEGSIVAADALVPEGVSFPANSYIQGTPGRRIRETTPEERAETRARISSALRG